MAGAQPKTAGHASTKRSTKAAAGRKLKDNYIMIRVEGGQKEQIEAMAIRENQSTANFARTALLKLVDGWQLVPPDWKVLPPDRDKR